MRIGRGDLLLDRAELALQIGDERLAVLPIHKARARAMLVSRLATARPVSFGLCAPASSNRSRRLARAEPVLISISKSARLAAPSVSRFFAFSVVFDAIGNQFCLGGL